METLQTLNHKQDQTERPHPEPDTSSLSNEDLAWEPLGDDLWLPHRIRGSWRGGVLG